MIFFDGEIYENDMCDKLLARFEYRICDTLGNCRLSAKQVMLAAEKISAGDTVSVDFNTGIITDETTGEKFKGEPYPEFMQRIISAGGLVNYVNGQK